MTRHKIAALFIFIFLLAFPLVSDKIVYAQGCGEFCRATNTCDSPYTCGPGGFCEGDDCSCSTTANPSIPGWCTPGLVCPGEWNYLSDPTCEPYWCCSQQAPGEGQGRCADPCDSLDECDTGQGYGCFNGVCTHPSTCPGCTGGTSGLPGACTTESSCLADGRNPETPAPGSCSETGGVCCTSAPNDISCNFLNLPSTMQLLDSVVVTFTSERTNTQFTLYTLLGCNITPMNITTDANGQAEFQLQCTTTGDKTISAVLYIDPNHVICQAEFTVQDCPWGGCPPQVPPPGDMESPLCPDGVSINTAIGCIPISSGDDFMGFIFGWAIGIAGGVALLLIIYAGIQIMAAAGNPQKIQAGKELLTAAIAGFLFLLLSAYMLRFIGIEVLQIPGL